MEELADSFDTKAVSSVTMTENNLIMKTNHELDLQLEQMIDKNEGLWKCKVCGKTATTCLKRHAETHVEGMSRRGHVISAVEA